jgi:hypothetical protein
MRWDVAFEIIGGIMMATEKYIAVTTSEYALLDPDVSSSSVPLNAHFEICIQKSCAGSADETECAAPDPADQESDAPDPADQENAAPDPADSADQEGAAPTPAGPGGAVCALPAAAVELSGLASGAAPLFGSLQEVKDFSDSLRLSDPAWNKQYEEGTDVIRFTYCKRAHTLADDFMLRIYSDAFNSTADHNGRANIKIETELFSLQFDDAFDDSYTINVVKMYAPRITSFGPKDLAPADKDGSEYSIGFGKEVVLKWETIGDSLRAPLLSCNGGTPETVAVDGEAHFVIREPSVFRLSLGSNAVPGLSDSRVISFGISTPPDISLGWSGGVCFAGDPLTLNYSASSVLNLSISSDNSMERAIDAPVTAGSVTAHPNLRDGKNRKIVYTLTASGFKDKTPVTMMTSTNVHFSRWENARQTSTLPPPIAENGGVVRIYDGPDKYTCLAGQSVWRSDDGRNWSEFLKIDVPDGVDPEQVRSSCTVQGSEMHIVSGGNDGRLSLTILSSDKKHEKNTFPFGLDGVRADGSLVCIDDGSLAHMDGEVWLYFFIGNEGGVGIYRYSYTDARSDSPSRIYSDFPSGNVSFAYFEDGSPKWPGLPYLNIPVIASFKVNGESGRLLTECRVKYIDSITSKNHLYLAAIGDDDMIYIYYSSCNRDKWGGRFPNFTLSPVCIASGDYWVKLFEVNDRIYVATNTGIYDVWDGRREDVMFDARPKMLGFIGFQLYGVDSSANMWRWNC